MNWGNVHIIYSSTSLNTLTITLNFNTLDRILVIGAAGQIGSDLTLNALNSANFTILIVENHAYTSDEISAIHDYVRYGGRLMIIVGPKGQANADNLLSELDISTVSSPVMVTDVDDVGDLNYTANGGAFVVAPNASATSVWISCIPTTNDWDELNAGKTDIYVTYVDNSVVT